MSAAGLLEAGQPGTPSGRGQGKGQGHRLLGVGEERELLIAYKEDGDMRARARLIRHNTRLVRREAKDAYLRWTRRHGAPGERRRGASSGGLTLPYLVVEDLEQEGFVALLEAIEGFDLDQGVRLATYATHCVRYAIARALGDTGGCIHVNEKMRSSMGRYLEVVAAYREEHGGTKEPSDREAARLMGGSCGELRVRRIKAALRVRSDAAPLSSLEGPAETDPEHAGRSAASPSEPASGGGASGGAGGDACGGFEEEVVAGASDEKTLKIALGTLPEPYRNVLIDRYGLFGHPRRTLKTIAGREGITENGVWHREKTARAHLARALEEAAGGPEVARQLFQGMAA